ncbi:4-(cytidine 5'-diphospho)-2-C-methyl-D-erythritol kinase [Aureococcus anophagefferens]|nr:4-(cytidine 5'-diphospho)-2-C-methyl-D-erythritol kinase [Aureococcus anophagefferens]
MREGTRDFRRRAVVAHRLQYHPSEQPSVVSAFEKSIDGLKKHVKTVMRSVYFLAKKNVAIRNVKDLVHLLRQSGAALGKAYVNDHAAADFVLALAHVVRAPIIAAAQAPRPKAVMMDESTDVSHSGNMIIYLRVFIKGKYTTVFWRILHVPDATALGLFTALAAAFEMDGIPTSTIVSFASDGAAVLMGSVNGVAVRARKRFNARIVVAHCVGHRHALTAVDAATGNLVAETLDTSMAEVVTYHSNSNQRRDHLAKLQESLKIPRLAVLSFVRTRWLCRGQVSARLLTALPALQLEFKADAEANVKTAAALYELTTSYAFVLSLVIFADILRQLNLVSLCFQKEHVRYSDVSRTLASDTEMETFCYRGMTLTFDGEADGRVKAGAVAFAGAVSRGYDDRFPHDKILVALEKFDFTQMPVGEAWDKVKATYGNAEIEVLASHYGYNMSVDGTVYEPQLDPMQLRAEWSAFRTLPGHEAVGPSSSRHLAAIVLSTVCCERGFSTMAWVKSKLRNRMSIIMLDALMMIILNGPDMSDAAAVDDLIEKAYDFWAKQAKRTPSRSHPGVARPRKKTAFADCECHFDPDDGDTGDEGAPSESTGPTITGDDLVQAVGIFPGLEGYEALPKPSGTSEDWKKELKTFKWRGLLLAHVFEGGWATGKYVKKATRRESPNSEVGFYVFYYADVGQYLAHNLGLEEHGDTRSWLILKQAELARLA